MTQIEEKLAKFTQIDQNRIMITLLTKLAHNKDNIKAVIDAIDQYANSFEILKKEEKDEQIVIKIENEEKNHAQIITNLLNSAIIANEEFSLKIEKNGDERIFKEKSCSQSKLGVVTYSDAIKIRIQFPYDNELKDHLKKLKFRWNGGIKNGNSRDRHGWEKQFDDWNQIEEFVNAFIKEWVNFTWLKQILLYFQNNQSFVL